MLSRGNKAIRENALQQLRALQKKMELEHPDLLERIRKEVRTQELRQSLSGGQSAYAADELRIDRKKNIETVLQFALSYQGSPEFQKKLKDVLLGIRH